MLYSRSACLRLLCGVAVVLAATACGEDEQLTEPRTPSSQHFTFVIKGYVRDRSTDEPIEDVEVYVSRDVIPDMSTTTNERGFYSLTFSFSCIPGPTGVGALIIAGKPGWCYHKALTKCTGDEQSIDFDLPSDNTPSEILGCGIQWQ